MNAHDARYVASVRSLAAEFGFCDPANRGELAQLFDGAGRKRRYLRKSGVNLDNFGEILWDRGIVPDRPSVNAVLAILSQVFDSTGPVKAGRKVAKREAVSSIEHEAARAKAVRARLYECACGQKVRGTRQTEVVCARCLDSVFASLAAELAHELGERVTGAIMATVRAFIVPIPRVSLLPEEVLAQMAGA